MAKSVPGFVLGLIGGILATLTGLVAVLATELIAEVVCILREAVGGIETFDKTMLYIVSWSTLVGGVFGIISATLALSKARLAGIFLLISAGLLATFFYYGFNVWTFILVTLNFLGGIISLLARREGKTSTSVK